MVESTAQPPITSPVSVPLTYTINLYVPPTIPIRYQNAVHHNAYAKRITTKCTPHTYPQPQPLVTAEYTCIGAHPSYSQSIHHPPSQTQSIQTQAIPTPLPPHHPKLKILLLAGRRPPTYIPFLLPQHVSEALATAIAAPAILESAARDSSFPVSRRPR